MFSIMVFEDFPGGGGGKRVEKKWFSTFARKRNPPNAEFGFETGEHLQVKARSSRTRVRGIDETTGHVVVAYPPLVLFRCRPCVRTIKTKANGTLKRLACCLDADSFSSNCDFREETLKTRPAVLITPTTFLSFIFR